MRTRLILVVVGRYQQEQRRLDLCQPLCMCRNVSASSLLVFQSFIIRIRYYPLTLSISTSQGAAVSKGLCTLTHTRSLTELQGDGSSQALAATAGDVFVWAQV